MPRRTKKPSDPNKIAYQGMQVLLETLDPESLEKPKRPAASQPKGVAGGKARAKKLSAAKRKAIAKKAAKKRWRHGED
jgi:hypothetical protein